VEVEQREDGSRLVRLRKGGLGAALLEPPAERAWV
jgi:hypothetical protein